MKRIYVSLLFLSSSLYCCVDPTPLSELAGTGGKKRANAVEANQTVVVANGKPGVTNFPKGPVTRLGSPGNYYYQCNYGGFLFNFGYSFPHPISIASYQTGTPYTASILSVSSGPTPMGEFRMALDGSSFTATFCTLSGVIPVNAHASLDAYYTKFDNFVTQATNPATGLPKEPTLPDYTTTATNMGYNPAVNGIITIKGRFILDHTSAVTNVSIIDIGYLPVLLPEP
jgi:hypothetical protein